MARDREQNLTGSARRSRVLLARPALKRATEAAELADPKETGGVLMGFRSGDDVCVTHLLEVPAVVATTTRYACDEAARNAAIKAFQAGPSPDPRVGYVGTWHSHPGTSRTSRTDHKTLRDEALHAPDLVAMLVVLRSRSGEWRLDGHIGHHEKVLEHRRGRRVFRHAPRVTPVDLELCD
jgi:integrative and conjugative element protein (TIGR02256 family)